MVPLGMATKRRSYRVIADDGSISDHLSLRKAKTKARSHADALVVKRCVVGRGDVVRVPVLRCRQQVCRPGIDFGGHAPPVHVPQGGTTYSRVNGPVHYAPLPPDIGTIPRVQELAMKTKASEDLAYALRTVGEHDIAERVEEQAEAELLALDSLVAGLEEDWGDEVGEGGDLDLGGREREQISLGEDLAAIWQDWTGRADRAWGYGSRFNQDSTEAELHDILRHVAHYHGGGGGPLREGVTNDDLVAAAEDAYNDWAKHRSRRLLPRRRT